MANFEVKKSREMPQQPGNAATAGRCRNSREMQQQPGDAATSGKYSNSREMPQQPGDAATAGRCHNSREMQQQPGDATTTAGKNSYYSREYGKNSYYSREELVCGIAEPPAEISMEIAIDIAHIDPVDYLHAGGSPTVSRFSDCSIDRTDMIYLKLFYSNH